MSDNKNKLINQKFKHINFTSSFVSLMIIFKLTTKQFLTNKLSTFLSEIFSTQAKLECVIVFHVWFNYSLHTNIESTELANAALLLGY